MEFPKGEVEDAHLRPDVAVTETVLDEEPTAAAIVNFSTRKATGEEVVRLREEFDNSTGEEFDDQDPAERVEQFLADSAELFDLAKQSWREVRSALIAVKQAPAPDPDELQKLGNREYRRDPKRRAIFESGPNKAIAEIQSIVEELIEQNVEADGESLCKQGQSAKLYRKDMRKAGAEQPLYDTNSEQWDSLDPNTRELLSNLNLLRDRSFEGHLMDKSIEHRLRHFLHDPAVAEPFVERISELLTDEQAAQEFPGLLQALANHIRKHGDRSPLAAAYKKVITEPHTMATEFMEAALEGNVVIKQERVRSQLEAAAYATKMFVDLDDDTWLTTAAARWASQYDKWEDWQKTELNNYAVRIRNGEWKSFTDALSAHVNLGRLSGMSITGSRRVRSSQAVKESEVFTAALEAAEEPEAEQEREPITQFALLQRAGSGSMESSGEFALVSVGSLDEILDSKPFVSYLSRFKEKDMREHFERAMQHLTIDWFDHTTTRRLTSVRYETEETRQRNARRFSFRTFSGVPRNSATSKTRIIYDVVKVNGKNCLVIRGPYFKADIENLKQMP